MATVVLGVAGAAIGGAVSGWNPKAMQIGWSVGTLVGAGIEGSQSPTQDVNRLQDLRASGSAYGVPVGIVYGTHQVPGNIIWSGPLVETSEKTGVRLLGTRRRTFSYSVSLAVAWCRGPITRVKRIWAEDLLIYDYAAADPEGPYQIENYLGTETQTKDPTIAAAKAAETPAGDTPAYRGQAYSVLKDLPLATWGNRIPNPLKAEIEWLPDYEDIVLNDSPLMYYRFEDTPGKLQDSGSAAYHLTDTGGTSVQVTGKHGDDGISIPLNVSLQRVIGQVAALQDGTVSVEGWYQYKGDPIVNGGGHFSYVNPNTAEEAWDLFVSPNGATAHMDLRARVVTNAEGVTVIHQVQVDRDTAWHHVVWTYSEIDGSRLYHDGALLDTETTVIDQSIESDAANHLYVTGNDVRWDELAFYPTILDAETVAAHYSQSTRVSDVLADVFSQVGLTASDWSLAAATDRVRGYLVGSRTEARSAVAPLLQVFFTDLAEVDGNIVAVKRGGAVAATISADDLGCVVWGGAGEEPPALVSVRRTLDLELPQRVDLAYYSLEKDYEQSTQGDGRYTKASLDNLVTVTTPLVLTETEARQMAARLLYDGWTARETYTFTLPWRYLYLSPGDVVNLPVGASTRRVRITRLDVAFGGPLAVTAVLDDAGVLVQTVVGAAVETHEADAVVQETTLLAWSNNAVVNEDADAVGYYVAAAGATTGYWPGAVLYQSNDGGGSYQQVGPLDAPAIHGTTVGALAAGTTTGLWDDVNTVNVTMVNGSVESASDAEVLAGENLCRIGQEYLSFGVVTPVGGAVYTLSHLLRGRRGTDSLWGTHAAGDKFVLLEEGLYGRVDQGFAMRGKDVLLKAVTEGTALGDATAVPLTITGDEFKTYAPVDIVGTRDGSNNLTITWKRRTRVPEGLQDMYDEPLGETDEAYEVEILAANPDRIISAASGTATYTAAQQTSDGLTPGDPVTVTVFQIGTYGRGYGRTATI